VSSGPEGTALNDAPVDRAYLDAVMGEIDDEVRRRRRNGDLPLRVERELDALFLRHAPLGSRDGGLDEPLRLVDAATFVDPVVPVASQKSGGALVKRGVRQLTLWYMGYITQQVGQFASAVGRSLHAVDQQLQDLADRLDAQSSPPAPVIELDSQRPGGWWVETAIEAVSGLPGRVLHAAAGDGWLVQLLVDRGVDAYGVDPRPDTFDPAEATVDLREEELAAHLRAMAPGTLSALVLTGLVDGMTPGQRRHLLELSLDRLAPAGRLVLHSASPQWWQADDAPPEADLAAGRPLRRASWEHLFGRYGCSVSTHDGPASAEYVVVATRKAAPEADWTRRPRS
jgi:hypothetical protein